MKRRKYFSGVNYFLWTVLTLLTVVGGGEEESFHEKQFSPWTVFDSVGGSGKRRREEENSFSGANYFLHEQSKQSWCC